MRDCDFTKLTETLENVVDVGGLKTVLGGLLDALKESGSQCVMNVPITITVNAVQAAVWGGSIANGNGTTLNGTCEPGRSPADESEVSKEKQA